MQLLPAPWLGAVEHMALRSETGGGAVGRYSFAL